MQAEYHFTPCGKNAKLLNPSKYMEKEKRIELIDSIHAQDFEQSLPLQYTTFPGASHSNRNSNLNHTTLFPMKASYNHPIMVHY